MAVDVPGLQTAPLHNEVLGYLLRGSSSGLVAPIRQPDHRPRRRESVDAVGTPTQKVPPLLTSTPQPGSQQADASFDGHPQKAAGTSSAIPPVLPAAGFEPAVQLRLVREVDYDQR